jgi:hypothetical protein
MLGEVIAFLPYVECALMLRMRAIFNAGGMNKLLSDRNFMA